MESSQSTRNSFLCHVCKHNVIPHENEGNRKSKKKVEVAETPATQSDPATANAAAAETVNQNNTYSLQPPKPTTETPSQTTQSPIIHDEYRDDGMPQSADTHENKAESHLSHTSSIDQLLDSTAADKSLDSSNGININIKMSI